MRSIVTFKPVGRLGNFLFEAASCMAYAWDNNIDFSIPSVTNDPKWNPIYLPHLVRYDLGQPANTMIVGERMFPYHERKLNPLWRNNFKIILEGYWQTEKYFKHWRPQIIEAFGFLDLTSLYTVAVHVRRGDYLTIKKTVNGKEIYKHPPVTKEWYYEQMAKFPNYDFRFFSDDIAWCKENFKDSKFRFSEGQSELVDLIDMSQCEHQICSASTFSWWAAWLNQNPDKRIIFPKHWITPGWSNLDFRDILPLDWIRA